MNEKLLESRVTTIDRLQVLNEINRRKATVSFEHYVKYMKFDYDMQWFHQFICNKLQEFAEGKIKKLMIFLPPQHGKSELSSRMLPAYILGQDPNRRIAVTTYGYSVAKRFNRDIQRYIESNEYRNIFPETKITFAKNERKDVGHARTTEEFHTVGHSGFVRTVGIGGGLTSVTIDTAIIDDPFKDRQEANSIVTRDRVWDGYRDVLTTRLHNSSQVLGLFTRWHEDDLAGRIFDPENEHYDESEASEWTIIAIPALKELERPMPRAIDIPDPRRIDEALWEERHEAAKYIKRRRTNPMGFASLDQQRPKTLGGNIVKGSWFPYIEKQMLPFNPNTTPAHFIIDGAYTEKEENDETGIMSYYKFEGRVYIDKVVGVRMEMNELLKFFPKFAMENGYKGNSYIRIEPKATGLSLISMLKSHSYGSMNAMQINPRFVRYGKMMRVENSLATMESGKIILIKDNWNQKLINQLEAFPNGTLDDLVDCLTYTIHIEYIAKLTSGGVKYK